MRVNKHSCSEVGCDRDAKARGLCGNHYQKATYHGLLPKTREKTCRECGAVFTDRKWNSVYCSQRCRYRGGYALKTAGRQRRTEACEQCGGPMDAMRTDARFCSVKCGSDSRWSRLRAARRASRKPCVHCGQAIPLNARRFCSKGCSHAHRRPEKYGLSPDELRALLAQHNVCAICRSPQWGRKGPQVDHDHVTGKVRGVLCSSCNNGLGRFKDDPAILRAAAEYLTT